MKRLLLAYCIGAVLLSARTAQCVDDGTILVRFPTAAGELIESSPAISQSDGAIYFTTRKLPSGTGHGFLYAINTAGQQRAHVDLGIADSHGIISSPSI